MSYEMIVKEAIRRQEIFSNLEGYLQIIKETIHKVDPESEIYLFGSVAEKRYTYSSDIDVLVITRTEPAKIHYELWRAGIKDPFEIHVQPPEKIDVYKNRTTLVEI